MKKLDKYEVLGELGHGAMGVVYRAHDPIINRPVALKTITTGVADDPEMLKRFYREAQSAGGLQHPNIVTIYDMGEAGGLPYIAMELVEGENLDQVIARRSPLPLTLKLAYGVQTCRALDYAHKRGIVHRDIKPGNVMVSKDGTVKVVDFGIARVLETSRTMTGMLIGTFVYMSPEQYHGEHADERSDIWSLGVLVYELLTYQRPFTGPTPASVMHNICSEDPAPLSKLLPECPKELEAVVLKMLRKSPSDRYQSMEDVLLDLDPVCKTLQSQSIADLLDQSRQQFDQGRFAEARDLVRQVLQLESGNQQARALLEKTNAELKRILNRPKAKQYVEKGQALLGEGKLQEAKVAAENALLLDSGFAPATDLQRAVLKELERVALLAGWLESAKQHLAEGLLDEAERMLAKVFEAEPSNPQAQYVQQQVQRVKAEREKGRRLLKGLQQAHELWTLQSYDECLKLLRDLEREFPKEEEVSRLLETVREDQLGQQKRQSLLQGRDLLASGRHEDAIALLSDLQRQFPSDEEIPELLEEVRKDQMNQRRLLGLAEARSLLAASQYDACIAMLNALSKSFPDEPEIPKLLETAQQSRTELARNRGFLEAGKLLASRQYEGCLTFLAELEKQFPGDEEILALKKVVREDQAEHEKQQGLEEARRLLTARRYDPCSELLADLEKRFPADAEIPRLQNTVREDRAKQRRLQGLERARRFLASKNYEKSVALLVSLQQEFPEDEETRRLLESARKEQAEQRKREGLAQARDLLGARHYEESIALLTKLQTEFAGESAITKLLESARKEQAEQRKREGLAQARDLLGARHYEESIALLTKLQTEFAGESAIAKLLESARKEQAQQRQREGLAQARSLLAERRYDESIILLGKLQADFPGGSEIAKLLADAREELAEQQKEQKLAEARSLFAAQLFAEAQALLDVLADDHPKDSAVTKLRVLVQREQDKHVKAEKVQRELDALKELMGEKKYPEVIARTKELLAEFPAEPNFTRLAEFAMSRQAIVEKELLFKQKFEEAKAFFDDGRYEEAMGVLQNALKTFPANVELQNLYQQSETHQKKQQVRQKIEQRVREIKVKINREELSDAVNLAKQTLVTLGPNTDVTQLLSSAQVELEAREKKRSQEGALETIRTLIESGDLDGASRKIDDAVKSQALDSFDPRMQRLSEQIKAAQTAKIASPREPLSTPPTIAPDLSKEYAFLQASPLPEAAAPPEKTPPLDSLTSIAPFSAGTSLAPAKPDSASTSVPAFEMHIERSPSPAIFPHEVEPRPASQAVSVPRWRKSATLVIAALALPRWRKLATLVIAALALVAAVWVGLRWRTNRVDRLEERQRQALVAAETKIKAKDLEGALGELQQAPVTGGPLTAQIQAKIHQIELSKSEAVQRQALDAADKLIAKNDLDGALQILEQAQSGPLSKEIHEKMQQLDESKHDTNLERLRQGEAVLWQQAISHVEARRYKEAEKYLNQILALPSGGVRKADAQGYLDKTIPEHKQNDKLLAEAKESLARGDIKAASSFAEQLQQNGGDARSVIAEIDRGRSAEQVRADQAKQAQLKQLENQFAELRQRDDESAIQQLTALQPQFQTLAGDGGPQSSEALGYVNNIPGAIAEVRDRMDKRRVDEKRKQADTEFRQMEQNYRQAAAANDKNGLAAAREYFQSVVRESRPHADSAQQYLAEIERKLDALNQPPPRPPNEVATPSESPLNPAAAEAAVRSTVQRFFQAFQQRNVDGLKQIWPGISREKYSKYRDSFQHVSSIDIQIVSENVKVSPDGTTATVAVQSQMQETPIGGKMQRFTPPWTFHLAKTNGTWLIRDVL